MSPEELEKELKKKDPWNQLETKVKDCKQVLEAHKRDYFGKPDPMGWRVMECRRLDYWKELLTIPEMPDWLEKRYERNRKA